jgi:hypothetical protein
VSNTSPQSSGLLLRLYVEQCGDCDLIVIVAYRTFKEPHITQMSTMLKTPERMAAHGLLRIVVRARWAENFSESSRGATTSQDHLLQAAAHSTGSAVIASESKDSAVFALPAELAADVAGEEGDF